MPGNTLLDIIKKSSLDQIKRTVPDLLFGEVTSITPLKIKVDNRFEVTEEFIILSAGVREVSWWAGLRVADKVLMLRLNEGQLFYVLEKEGGLNV